MDPQSKMCLFVLDLNLLNLCIKFLFVLLFFLTRHKKKLLMAEDVMEALQWTRLITERTISKTILTALSMTQGQHHIIIIV